MPDSWIFPPESGQHFNWVDSKIKKHLKHTDCYWFPISVGIVKPAWRSLKCGAMEEKLLNCCSKCQWAFSHLAKHSAYGEIYSLDLVISMELELNPTLPEMRTFFPRKQPTNREDGKSGEFTLVSQQFSQTSHITLCRPKQPLSTLKILAGLESSMSEETTPKKVKGVCLQKNHGTPI